MELQFYPDSARKLSANLYDKYHYCVYNENTPDDGQRNCPKHVALHSKKKFEKLVHLVDFIIRNYLSSSMNTKLCRSHGYRSETRLKLTDNRMLKIQPALKRKAVRGRWIKVRNKELHTSTKFYSDEQIKVDDVGGACGTCCKEGKSNNGFCGKT